MLYPNNMPREASLPVSVKIGILKYTTYIFFSPKEYNCHLLDGYLRDDIQYPRHVTFGVQPQGRLRSPAALSSRVPSPSVPGPPTGHCCVPPHPSPAPLSPSWHVSLPEPHPSTSPLFLFSAAASGWLFLLLRISCLLLRPWDPVIFGGLSGAILVHQE